jgi:hypothetical protein
MAMFQKFTANNKKLPILLEKQAYKIGTVGDIIIGGDGVQKEHCLVVSITGSSHEIIPSKNGFVKINNKTIKERKKLEHNDVLIFSKKPTYNSILVYSNELLNSLKNETKRLSAVKMTDIQNLVVSANTKTRIYEKEFYEDCPLDSNITGLCRYTISFLMSKFKTTRGIVYRTIKNRWIPIVAICPESKYMPSKSLMKEVHTKQEPILFNVLDFDEQNIAMSIINNKTYSALCVPIVIKDNMVGVIYLDTLKEDRQLTGEDLMIILNIIPSFSVLFRQAINKLLEKNITKEEKTEQKKETKLESTKEEKIEPTKLANDFEIKINKILSPLEVVDTFCIGDNFAKIARCHFSSGNMQHCFFGYISPIEQNYVWSITKTNINSAVVSPSQEDLFLYQLNNQIETIDSKLNTKHYLNLALFTYCVDKKYLSIILQGDVCLVLQKGTDNPYKHSDGKSIENDCLFVEDEVNNFENAIIIACKIKEANSAEYVLNKNKGVSDIAQIKQDLISQGMNHFVILKK